MLIVFEGIDGSGKGEQVARFLSFLRQKGLPFRLHKYPTSKAKDALAHLAGEQEVEPSELARVFAEDIADGQGEIRRSLAEGKVVVCDRYLHSTLAYQAVKLGYGALAAKLLEYGVAEPDLAVILDIPARIGVERKGRQKTLDRFERDSGFLSKVRKNYLREAKECFLAHKYIVVDAARAPDEVFSEILMGAEPFLTKKIEK